MIVDGRELTEEEMKKIKKELENDCNRKLVETAPGEYRILDRLLG
jgi:hypothetical protein